MAMMPSKGTNGIYRPLAEINVTPLVDVMLVLLIIFMVTAPMLASGMKVNLPQAKQVQPLDPKAPIVITVGKDGTISLGSDTIDHDRLIDAVQAKLGGDINQVIHLRGDKEAFYGDVVAIMDQLAANGLTHIAIVADPHRQQEPPAKTGMQTNKTVPETRTNPAVSVPVERSPASTSDMAPAGNAPIAPATATAPASSATASPAKIESGDAPRP